MNSCTLIEEFRDLGRFVERRQLERQQEREERIARIERLRTARHDGPNSTARLLDAMQPGTAYTWGDIRALADGMGIADSVWRSAMARLLDSGRVRASRALRNKTYSKPIH